MLGIGRRPAGEARGAQGGFEGEALARGQLPVLRGKLGIGPLQFGGVRPSRRLALGRGDGGDLPEAATRLGGAGPGLTPAGDDALGGILFARRALGGDACGDDLAAIASGVRTTGISGSLSSCGQ